MRNIGDSEQIVELSSALDKFHSGLTASGIIGTGISLNLDEGLCANYWNAMGTVVLHQFLCNNGVASCKPGGCIRIGGIFCRNRA